MSKEQISQSFDNEFNLAFGQQLPDIGLETRILDQENISAQLPPLAFVAKAEFSRNGQDLIMKVADEGGEKSIVIKNYFAGAIPQVLKTIDGAVISPQMVNAFIKNNGDEQFFAQGIFDKLLARGGKTNMDEAVAIIENIEGNALVIRNGKAIALQKNDALLKGDVISTPEGGKLEIIFADGTNFQIGGEARMSLDDFSFDATTSKGLQILSILHGAFSYASGLVAKDDPSNVTLRTPIGEIGIRGTKVVGEINSDNAAASITILEGRIIYQNNQGQQFELNQGFDTLRISNGGDKVRETSISPERAAREYDVFNSIDELNQFLLQTEQSAAEDENIGETADSRDSLNEATQLPDISYSDAITIENAREQALAQLDNTDNIELVEATTAALLVQQDKGEKLFGGKENAPQIDIINVGGSDSREQNPYAGGAVDGRNNLFVIDLGNLNGKIQILLSEDNLGWLIDSGGKPITVTFHKINLEYSGSGTLFITEGGTDINFDASDVVVSSNFQSVSGEGGGGSDNDLLVVISAGADQTYRIIANEYFDGITAKTNGISTDFGFTITAVGDVPISSVADSSI